MDVLTKLLFILCELQITRFAFAKLRHLSVSLRPQKKKMPRIFLQKRIEGSAMLSSSVSSS
jgi:hypothetical protein